MTFNWICVTFALLLALCSSTWAAPSGEHGSKFDELERTLKELATTVLAMNGAGLGGGAGVGDEIGIDIGDDSFGDLDLDVLGSEAASALAALT